MRADTARRLTLLVRHNMVLRLRDPGHLVSYLVMPMVLMLVFSPLYQAALPGGGRAQAVIGMLVMFSVLSLSVVGTALLTERTWRTWNRLRASPASGVEMLVGKALPVFALLVLQQGLLLLFGSQVVGMPVTGTFALVLLAVCVWSFALLAIGVALAGFVRSHGELAAVSDVGALAVSALGGALAPISMMPAWAQALAPLSPGYWAVAMLGAAVSGDTGTVLRTALVLALVGVAAGALACFRIGRGIGDLRG
ncbi:MULTISPECIES: ABC transporter permease [Nocardiopsis]|uniref:Transport permease protein n=1 Tax=Nocardiopsis sinuspersici TaxID=501010 RepID=A0A1V3BYX7_9ACTN|nr:MULTISPECIES: ABC transporter permease [Nocardiopsis]NYH55019.1 ABC-2 type transport system permease protein [Nocardiopsis sinuspersici]OOC53741.1 ABC transporter [Nocardiopsis sinuspersici]